MGGYPLQPRNGSIADNRCGSVYNTDVSIWAQDKEITTMTLYGYLKLLSPTPIRHGIYLFLKLWRYGFRVVLGEHSGAVIINLGNKVYCVGRVIVEKNYRNMGYGRALIEKIHNKYQGIFVLQSMKSPRFFMELGYVDVGNGVFIYANKNILSDFEHGKL